MVARMSATAKGNPFLVSGSDRLVIDYPWGLNAEQIERLLECCGKERPFPYAEGVLESKLIEKLRIKSWERDEKSYLDKKCAKKIKYLLIGISCHPSICTPRMREIIETSPTFKGEVPVKRTEVVTLGNNEVTIINGDHEDVSPLAREEEVKTDILSNLLDKTQMVLDQLTLAKTKRMSGSQMTRSVEGLVHSYTLFKGEVKATPIHVNIGKLTLNQKRELSQNLGSKDK